MLKRGLYIYGKFRGCMIMYWVEKKAEIIIILKFRKIFVLLFIFIKN